MNGWNRFKLSNTLTSDQIKMHNMFDENDEEYKFATKWKMHFGCKWMWQMKFKKHMMQTFTQQKFNIG